MGRNGLMAEPRLWLIAFADGSVNHDYAVTAERAIEIQREIHHIDMAIIAVVRVPERE